jgi:hypothetical protein
MPLSIVNVGIQTIVYISYRALFHLKHFVLTNVASRSMYRLKMKTEHRIVMPIPNKGELLCCSYRLFVFNDKRRRLTIKNVTKLMKKQKYNDLSCIPTSHKVCLAS